MVPWARGRAGLLRLGMGLGRVWRFPAHSHRRQRAAAFAVYSRGPNARDWRAHSIQLLALQGDAIAALTLFKDPTLFGAFGLRAILPAQ